MPLIVVDVESDGPCPGLYSMVSLGAVVVDRSLDKTFYGTFRPISDKYDPEALSISKITRDQHFGYSNPKETMVAFQNWLKSVSSDRLIFVSDNLAFDWQFVNYYFALYDMKNPFGFSGRRIGDIYGGFRKDIRAKWKHLRNTPHTHHPVDDAKGNAEALIQMADMGIKGILKRS